MMIELEVANPPLWRPGYYKSNAQRRVWWGFFAVALTKGNAYERHQKIASGVRVWE